MKQILVPIDFSPVSERALQYAIRLASWTGGSVIVFHVYEPLESAFIDRHTDVDAYNKQMEMNLLKQMQRLCARVISPASPVPVSTVLGRSPVVDNILGFAEHHEVELIVMGTQGASGLKRVLIGSIATRVIQQADCPVLLIPEKFEWKDPELFAYASAYMETDSFGLAKAIEMARIYHAELFIVHLAGSFGSAADKEKQRLAFEQFAIRTRSDYPNDPLHFRLLFADSVIKGMERLHLDLPYDLLIMLRRKKSQLQQFFFESFTADMSYTTHYPLLVIPEPE